MKSTRHGLLNMTALSIIAGIVTLVSFTTYFVIKKKEPSAWQQSIEKKFTQKKSGRFQATDKTGRPVTIEWLTTNVHDPEIAQTLRSVVELVVRAFVPIYLQSFKAHPEEIFTIEKDNPYKQLEPLLKDGVEKADWILIEEKLSSIEREKWLKMTKVDEMLKLEKTIIFFVAAKDSTTNKSLGFICYRIDSSNQNGAILIETLAVVPEEQKRGLAKLLISSIFRIIPRATYISLGTRKDNNIAITAYTALGFTQRPVETNDTNVTMEYRVEKSNVLQKAATSLVAVEK